MLNLTVEPPVATQIKQKALLVIKARPETKESGFPNGIASEVVFMEINKPILDNLYTTCQVCNCLFYIFQIGLHRLIRLMSGFKF